MLIYGFVLCGIAITVGLAAALAVERRFLTAPFIFAVSLNGPIFLYQIELSLITYSALFVATLMFVAGYIMFVRTRQTEIGVTPSSCPVAPDIIAFYKKASILIFAVAQTAFLINLLRVFQTYGLDAYITRSAKDIEVIFGAFTTINYFFFLNMLNACLFLWLYKHEAQKKRYLIFASLSLVALFFTGIKSTMLLSVTTAFMFANYLFKLPKSFFVVAAVLICALTLFLFSVVNLGLISAGFRVNMVALLYDAIRNYIYWNYINLDLELAFRNDFTYGRITFFFYTKLTNPGVVGYFDLNEFILWNKNNNMGTLLREYWVDFGVPGIGLMPLIFGSVTGAVRKAARNDRTPRFLFFLAILLTAATFAFFGNTFIRLQFIWVVLAAFGLEMLRVTFRNAPLAVLKRKIS